MIMSNFSGEDESEFVLSDVDDEDNYSPATVKFVNLSPSDVVSVDKFRGLLAELEREKQARVIAENSKSELQVSFNRLKVLVHEAIKKRDEAVREKDEVLRGDEKLGSELEEVKKAKDEVLTRLEVARAEIEGAAKMLVIGIEKISGKVNHIRNFTGVVLPRSEKYTGLPAVVYGVIERTNEIVEVVVKEIEMANKSRDEARKEVDHRDYEIAVEVSEVEASISKLREEVAEKSSRIEGLKECIVEKDGKLGEIVNEKAELKKMVNDYEAKVRDLEAKMAGQRPLLGEQLSFVTKIHDQLHNVIRIVDASNGDQSDFVESMFLLPDTGLEENIHASLAGLESILELSKIVSVKTKDVVEDNSRAVKSLNETVARLFREKEHVGVLLRSALSKKLTSNPTSKTNKVFQAAEDGLREAGIDFKFGVFFEDEKLATQVNKERTQETKDDEIYALASTLENIIKEAQLQIIELQHSVEELRAESSLLKDRLETQSKELSHRKHCIEELKLKEREADENIQGLRMDIAAAEEEITRWKGAAEQEAAAGSTIEEEYISQIASYKQEIEEVKQRMSELVKKLKSKEEIAAAAMAAREAADNSLRLADIRATRLRGRVEELAHQLESLDSKSDSKSQTRPRYACWPWEWLGIDFVGPQQPIDPPEQSSNEMELSEPLL